MAQHVRDLQLIELKDSINSLNDTIRSLQEMLAAKDKQVAELLARIDVMQEQNDYLKQKLFGRSSEKGIVQIPGQMELFNEAEAEQKPELLSEEDAAAIAQEMDPPKKPRKSKATMRETLAGLPVEKVYLDLPEDQKVCSQCGTPLEKIGTEFVRRELEIIPAKAKVIEYYSVNYKCPGCEKDFELPTIVKGKDGHPHMLHGMASSATVAWVMHQKYCNSMPLYRQEQDFKRLYGVDISRGTMANWIISNATDFLTPMFDYFHRVYLGRKFNMADETPVQVLHEEGRKAKTKSYMWVFRSGERDGPQMVLYRYYQTRAGENAREFLKGFSGYLMCDGYSGYNSLPGVKRCSCWAHVRRYLVEAIPKGKQLDYSQPAVQGTLYVNRLFDMEKAILGAHKDPDAIKEARIRKERPLLDSFWEWLDAQHPVKGTRLEKAVTYIRNRKKDLETYLEDGRCSLSNNASERSVKPFVIGRKNWLFSDTPDGATASAVIYSIIETAKANEVNSYHYLQFLLDKCPNASMSDEELDALAPWNRQVQLEVERRFIDAQRII